jgi:hypothetical protein
MAYRLKPGRPIAAEVRRIGEKQLELALAAMQRVGTRHSDKCTHRARRHIKKIRALIRLFEPSLAHSCDAANRQLRTVNRLLAPVADGEAVVDTIARIGGRYRHRRPRRTFETVRAGLVELEFRAGRKANFDRVLERATRLLHGEQKCTRLWDLRAPGFRAVAPGLERSVRRCRRAMLRARRHPTDEHYHVWRQRVKDLWLHVRLIQARCGRRLAREEAQLDRLDGCLGEYHNCVLLARILAAEPLTTRQRTARCLRLIRCYQEDLRREIHPLASEIHREKPRQFVQRVHRLWRLANTSTRTTAEAGPVWQRAA